MTSISTASAAPTTTVADRPTTTITETTVTTEPTTTTATTKPTTTVPVVRPGVPPRGTVTEGSLVTEGSGERTYRLYVPSGVTSEDQVPLLLALHGGTGSGAQFETNSDFDTLAEANNFIVAYPDGTPIGTGSGRVWNGGDCCGRAQDSRDNVDDVGFIAQLIDAIEAEYPVNPARVYATGHSNGAILSYRLACELADTITAVAFQAGTIEIGECRPSRPISVLAIHGTADTNIPIEGGFGDGFSRTDFTSPQESIATMAELDGCGPMVETVDPGNPAVTHRLWNECRRGVTVEMTIVTGANHAWMGHAATRLQEALVGTPYPGYDSSLAVWTFLAANG